MSLPQTSYSNVPSEALLGKVDQCSDEDKISRVASEALPYGVFVFQNAAPGSTGLSPGTVKKIVDAKADMVGILGVSVYEAARSPYTAPGTAYDSGGADYASGEDVAILRRGRIWMWTENAATQGNAVYVRCTAASGKPNGQVRDGTAANFVAHGTAVFMTSTSGAGLVLVEVK